VSEAFPSIPIRRYRLDLNENKAIHESIFTRQRQVVTLGGGTSDRWEGLIETRPLTRAQAKTLQNFLIKVGLYGEFTIGVPGYSGPASGETVGAVVGAGQTGNSLDCDGFSASITVAKAGDYIQVRNQFLYLTADAVSNGDGEVTFAFKPALRVSPANEDPVVLNTPKLLAQLTSIPSIELDAGQFMPVQITFQEVLKGE
jgi:hypothetical protein